MVRGRPAFRIDLLIQGAAFVALVVVFLLLLSQLRDDPQKTKAAPPAPKDVPPTAPVVLLAPPSPSSQAQEKPKEARSDANVALATAGAQAHKEAQPEPNDPRAKRIHPRFVVRPADDMGLVEGALVNARTAKRKLHPEVTNGKGEVDLDEVSTSEGPLHVTIRHAVYGKQSFLVEIREHRQRILLGHSRSGTLRGSVATTQGAVPSKGATLTILGLEDLDGVETEIELSPQRLQEGRFALNLAAGTYTIRASSPSYCPSSWQPATIRLGDDENVAFVLQRADTISGTVVFPAGRHGGGVVDMDVELQTNDGPVCETRRVKTGFSGSYKLDGLVPGWYRIRACDRKEEGPWATLQVVERIPVEGFPLFLSGDPRDPRIEGVVKDHEGAPLADATVAVKGRETKTDEKGYFVIRCNANDDATNLLVHKNGYQAVSKAVSSKIAGAKPIEVALDPLE